MKKEVMKYLRQRKCIENQQLKNSRNFNTEKLPPVDVFLNPNDKEYIQKIIESKISSTKQYFQTINMEKVYPNLFKLLWHSALPCFADENSFNNHLLKSCEIKGEKKDCRNIFKMVPSDVGMCCAMNVANTLKSSDYSNLIKDMQRRNNLDSNEMLAATIGKNSGIRLILDLHSNMLAFGSLAKDFNTFNIFIGGEGDFPLLSQSGISIQPGQEHFLDFSAEQVVSRDITTLIPEKRKCLFSWEGNLTYSDKYSLSNCMFECQLKNKEAHTGCIPWYLPKENKSRVCDPWTARRFKKPIDRIGKLELEQCGCFPNCEETIFSVTTTSAKFR